MAQIHKIRKGSTLPTLRMELIDDGRYSFLKNAKYNDAIQNADIKFSMINERGILKISNAEASIVKAKNEMCDDTYIIEYKWKERDTREQGIFEAFFSITFNDDIYQDGVTYPSGELKMPINEKLIIHII